MQFSIDSSSATPVYQQVKQSITLDILANRLKSGDLLPSIRELAKILKLNPNTVAKVYYSLEEEGYIEGKRGSGYRVRTQKNRMDNLKISMFNDELKNFLERAFALGFRKDEILEYVRRALDE